MSREAEAEPEPEPQPEGFSKEEKATDEIIELCNQIKPEVETQTGVQYGTYNPLSFIQQPVDGTIYIIKIRIGGYHCLHVKVYVPLPPTDETPTVQGIQSSKKQLDKIEPF